MSDNRDDVDKLFKNDKIEYKENYTAQEVEDLITELYLQQYFLIEGRARELKNEKEHKPDIEQAVIDKRLKEIGKIREQIWKLKGELKATWLTECCNAPINRIMMGTTGYCSECGENDPDSYQVEKDLEDFIERLNEIQEERK